MSLSAAALQLLLDKGLTLADVVEVASVIEDSSAPAPSVLDSREIKRAYDRERMRAKRELARQSHDSRSDNRGDVADDNSDPPTCERAQVVNTTSSLRSEGTQEANASFVDASKSTDPEKPNSTKSPKASRGSRLPEDWEPSEADVTIARTEGLTDEEIHRAAVEFRNYWCSRSRDATRLSWPKTWHNRVAEIADRKRRNSPRLVASSGQPGGHGRGAVSFADIYARRHGHASD